MHSSIEPGAWLTIGKFLQTLTLQESHPHYEAGRSPMFFPSQETPMPQKCFLSQTFLLFMGHAKSCEESYESLRMTNPFSIPGLEC